MKRPVSVYAERESTLRTQCPICGSNSMTIREVEYNLPELGRVLLVSRLCSRCGYKRSEIVPLTVKPRRRVYVRIDSERALRTKVVRVGTASIEIVELGVAIDPGVDAPTFLTNVEGLLDRVANALKSLEVLALSREEREIARKALENLQNLDVETKPLTVIIDDPAGVSKVSSRGEALILVEEVEGELTA